MLSSQLIADAPAAPAPAPEKGAVTKTSEATPLVGTDEEQEESFVAKYAAPISISFYIFIAMLKTMLTKALFSSSAMPVAFSAVSAIATCITLVPYFVFDRNAWAVPKLEYLPGFSLVCVFVALDLAFTNLAISMLAIALQQCILATNPAFCVAIETLILGKVQHVLTYVVVIVLCAGPIVANVYGAALEQTEIVGILVQIAGVFCSACKYVFAHAVMSRTKKDLGTVAFLFWTDILVLPILVPWAFFMGEWPIFFGSLTDVSIGFISFFTAVLGGVRFFSQLLVLRTCTATTLSSANLAYQAGNIYLSLLIFGTPVTIGLVGGSIITLTAAGFYTYLKVTRLLVKDRRMIELDRNVKGVICPCVMTPPALEEKPPDPKKLVAP